MSTNSIFRVGLQKKKKGQHLFFNGLDCSYANFLPFPIQIFSILEVLPIAILKLPFKIKDGWQLYSQCPLSELVKVGNTSIY